jgi:hypothetical protein
VKNDRSYTSIYAYAFMACIGATLSLLYLTKTAPKNITLVFNVEKLSLF